MTLSLIVDVDIGADDSRICPGLREYGRYSM